MNLSTLQNELLLKMNAFDAAVNIGAPQSELHSIYKEIKLLNHQITMSTNPSVWFALSPTGKMANAA